MKEEENEYRSQKYSKTINMYVCMYGFFVINCPRRVSAIFYVNVIKKKNKREKHCNIKYKRFTISMQKVALFAENKTNFHDVLFFINCCIYPTTFRRS